MIGISPGPNNKPNFFNHTMAPQHHEEINADELNVEDVSLSLQDALDQNDVMEAEEPSEKSESSQN
jgi:hypothetical protein